jgi:hypothetical protein
MSFEELLFRCYATAGSTSTDPKFWTTSGKKYPVTNIQEEQSYFHLEEMLLEKDSRHSHSSRA